MTRRSAAARRRQRGLSLLEILVALGIIALVASVAAPRVLGYLSRGKAQTAAMQLQGISSALELYFVDLTGFPPPDVGLKALLEAPPDQPGWRGPYLKGDNTLLDPWGRPYGYRLPGRTGEFAVYSLGRDGAAGGEGEDADIELDG